MPKPTDESLAHMLTHLCAAMRKAGLDKVESEYHGGGDSGDAFEVYSSSESDVNASVQGMDLSIRNAMKALSESVIERFHHDYKSNNGGGGKLACFSGGIIKLSAYETVMEERAGYYDSKVVGDITDKNKPPHEMQRLQLMNAMEIMGVRNIRVEYSGSGGSGGVDDVYISGKLANDTATTQCEILCKTISLDASGCQTHMWRPRKISLSDAARIITESLLDENFHGFENDTGGRGSAHFSLVAKSIAIEHVDYINATQYFSVGLVDPTCSDFQVLTLLSEHKIDTRNFYPLSRQQSNFRLHLKNEEDGGGAAPENASDEDLQVPQA